MGHFGPLAPGEPRMVLPDRETDLIRELGIIGKVGELGIINAILPTVSMGSVVQQTVQVLQPAFRTTDIFGSVVTAPAAGTVLADTGALAAGTFDVSIYMAGEPGGAAVRMAVEFRNAANSADLATWEHLLIRTPVTNSVNIPRYDLALEFALNERLRITVASNTVATTLWCAFIFARRRT